MNEQSDTLSDARLAEYSAPPRDSEEQFVKVVLVMLAWVSVFGSLRRNMAPPVDRLVQLMKVE